VSRVPEGLAHALRGIAERLEKSPERGRDKAGENAAALHALDRSHFTETFVAQWLAGACEQAAREIRVALEVWSKPPPRSRRRR
jgi:hypothetical protein